MLTYSLGDDLPAPVSLTPATADSSIAFAQSAVGDDAALNQLWLNDQILELRVKRTTLIATVAFSVAAGLAIWKLADLLFGR